MSESRRRTRTRSRSLEPLPMLDPTPLYGPGATDVDWPHLVAQCEQRGLPVSRMADDGTPYLIRSTRQLLQEWQD